MQLTLLRFFLTALQTFSIRITSPVREIINGLKLMVTAPTFMPLQTFIVDLVSPISIVIRGEGLMKLRLLFAVIGLLLLPSGLIAKEWRGIIPLKSTRADVDRRFGKPDKWGDYELNDERVSFDYGDGPCKGLYVALGKDKCKCSADENTVMSIFVEPTVRRKVSDLKIDMTRFRRTPISPFPNTFEYDNPEEGITYTVDEPNDEIKHVTYYPSPSDCEDIISRLGSARRNSWRGLVPLQSKRENVEALLGRPARRDLRTVTYETTHERIVAQYANGRCDASSPGWNVPEDTLLELTVNPTPGFLLQELDLDAHQYERREILPYPEIDNPPHVWIYIDNLHGITIRTQSSRGEGGEEVVVSITYGAERRDEKLRCNNLKQSGSPGLGLR
jgi:hypothetical protein